MIMKRLETLLDNMTEKRGSVILWTTGQRKDVDSFVKENYKEDVSEAIRLFEIEKNIAVGWIVFTNTRIFFLIHQSMNHFRNYNKVVWIIDDPKNANFDVKHSGTFENEIEISSGKCINYDPSFISGNRLISDIKKNIGLLIKSKQAGRKDKEKEREQKLTRERFFEIDNGYFMKAFNIQTEANQNFERANYDLCIRRSQEAFELYLKSIFLFLNKTHRREHDIGKELYDIRIILNRHGINDTKSPWHQ